MLITIGIGATVIVLTGYRATYRSGFSLGRRIGNSEGFNRGYDCRLNANRQIRDRVLEMARACDASSEEKNGLAYAAFILNVICNDPHFVIDLDPNEVRR